MSQTLIPQAMALAGRYHRAGQLRQAETIYRQVLQQQPDHLHALNNLGASLHAMGRLDEAEPCYRRVLALVPQHVDAQVNLGMLLQQAGRLEEAERSFRLAVQNDAGSARAWTALGSLLRIQGRLEEAEECHCRAVALEPQNAECHAKLGLLRMAQGRGAQAVACLRQSLAINPQDAAAHFNLGLAMQCQDQPEHAIDSFRKALNLRPDFAEVWYGLGSILVDRGRIEGAIPCFRRAVELRPNDAPWYSALLGQLQFLKIDNSTLRAEHEEWNRRHAQPLASQIRPHTNDRNPDRRLRIGYVSPNLRGHIIGTLLETFMVHHDRERFFIACYSDTAQQDQITANLKAHSDLWRDTRAISDEQLAEQIRHDQIDILVDLTLHMAYNRMLVFARKPAPVQVTYLGYPASTGLATMGFRLTDPYLSPPGQESEGPETLVFLPQCYWPYKIRADANAPEVNELPSMSRGYVAFACFNNIAKVNEDVISLWCRLLQVFPQSRLRLLVHGGPRNEHVYQAFERHGLNRTRLLLIDRQPPAEYLRLHHEVDIALDPFPYNGHTTSYDALYMGVPVVTLAGQRAVSRAGVSILSNLGLTELIAQTPDEYVRIAAGLAGDLPRLAELRRTLRERMRRSPLMDAQGFARDVEGAYREMWNAWACG